MRLAQLTSVLIPGISTLKYVPTRYSLLCQNTFAMNSDSAFTWHDLNVHREQLTPDSTLNNGQCFNWKKLQHTNSEIWVGVLANKACLIKQTESSTECLQLTKPCTSADFMSHLVNYFQLEFDLCHLYKTWGSGCSRMQVVTDLLKGVRVVRQDPWECLISFICSSNNNIPRITQMLDKLRGRYGTYICTLELVRCNTLQLPADALPIDYAATPGAPTPVDENTTYYWRASHHQLAHRSDQDADILYSQELYAFPTVEALAGASEEELRSLGMGYRAKFILASAQLVQQKSATDDLLVKEEQDTSTAGDVYPVGSGAAWFQKLRHLAYTARQGRTSKHTDTTTVKSECQENGTIKQEPTVFGAEALQMQNRVEEARLLVQKELLQLPGVGRKVADCVALFSLDQTSAVPVDTHVWNIAIRDYAPQLRKSEVKDEIVSEMPETSPSSPDTQKLQKKWKASTPGGNSDPSMSPISSPLGVFSPEPIDSIETKSLTPAVYEAVGDVFRSRFGPYAGWAHSVLFAAELATFRDKLPTEMQEQMKTFANLQRSAKKVKRDEKKEKQVKTPLRTEIKEESELVVAVSEDIQAALNNETPSFPSARNSLSEMKSPKTKRAKRK